MNINIFLVDDHQMFIDGMISIFEHEDEIKVIGHALNGLEALKKITSIEDQYSVKFTINQLIDNEINEK